MADKTPQVLTSEERLLFTTVSAELSAVEMARYYTLSERDKAFVFRQRKDENRLGIAIQLCLLRFPGRSLLQMTNLSEQFISYIAEQLNLPAEVFAKYGRRRKTPYDHLQTICQFYGYRPCGREDILPLARYLVPFALENDEALPLVDGALAWMREHKLIAPTILTTEKLVWHVQRIARWQVYRRITNTLTATQKATLQNLLLVDEEKNRQTPLFWLNIPSPKPSADGMYHLLERLAFQ